MYILIVQSYFVVIGRFIVSTGARRATDSWQDFSDEIPPTVTHLRSEIKLIPDG